jgi:hypothetical protein
MDNTQIPSITFPVENPGVTITATTFSWNVANTIFTRNYSVNTVTVNNLPDVDVRVSGARSASAWNPQVTFDAANEFDIDVNCVNPVANAGPDQPNACDPTNLAAVPPVGTATGVWTTGVPGVIISNPTSPGT